MSLDPNNVNLNSLDIGNAYSPDGREYQLTALMPLNVLSIGGPNSDSTTATTSQGPGTQYPTPASMGQASGVGNIITDWLSSHIPAHFGARLVLAILGILLIVVVAFRLVK